MAKTWTVKEAFEAIRKNDKAAIADFGKRFPLATVALTKAASEDGTMLFGAMPERVTMRVLDAELKGDIEDTADDDAEVEETKPVKKEKTEKAPAKTGKRGRPAKKEEPVEEGVDDEEDVAEEDDDATDYSKMGAVELFKLCKKRGIKVQPKQKSSVYIKALEAADADSDADDDAEEEEEEEKPVKKASKKAPAKAEKKASKKDADDDEDDWDI